MSDAGGGSKVDPNHPHVKALTDAGIGIDRLTQMVDSASKPIVHEAVTNSQSAIDQLAQQATTQQQQQAATPQIIPPLDTQGFQQASELGPMFQQLLSQIITPPVPQDPQLVSTTAPTGPSNGG